MIKTPTRRHSRWRHNNCGNRIWRTWVELRSWQL